MSRQKKNKRLNSQDFYPTPAWCYENLEIDWTQFSTAHEPCAGDHRIVDFLSEHGLPVTHTDILERVLNEIKDKNNNKFTLSFIENEIKTIKIEL